jgi:hypothetical protein
MQEVGTSIAGVPSISASGAHLGMLIEHGAGLDLDYVTTMQVPTTALVPQQDTWGVLTMYEPPWQGFPEKYLMLGLKLYSPSSPPGDGNDNPQIKQAGPPYTLTVDAPAISLMNPAVVSAAPGSIIAFRLGTRHWLKGLEDTVIPYGQAGWGTWSYDLTIKKTSLPLFSPISFVILNATITLGDDVVHHMTLEEGRVLAGIQ